MSQNPRSHLQELKRDPNDDLDKLEHIGQGFDISPSQINASTDGFKRSQPKSSAQGERKQSQPKYSEPKSQRVNRSKTDKRMYDSDNLQRPDITAFPTDHQDPSNISVSMSHNLQEKSVDVEDRNGIFLNNNSEIISQQPHNLSIGNALNH